jgi:hypothetical protein
MIGEIYIRKIPRMALLQIGDGRVSNTQLLHNNFVILILILKDSLKGNLMVLL